MCKTSDWLYKDPFSWVSWPLHFVFHALQEYLQCLHADLMSHLFNVRISCEDMNWLTQITNTKGGRTHHQTDKPSFLPSDFLTFNLTALLPAKEICTINHDCCSWTRTDTSVNSCHFTHFTGNPQNFNVFLFPHLIFIFFV